MSTNFTKTLVWKQDYDVKFWRHKQRTNKYKWLPYVTEWNPPWKFSAHATDRHERNPKILNQAALLSMTVTIKLDLFHQIISKIWIFESFHSWSWTASSTGASSLIASIVLLTEAHPLVMVWPIVSQVRWRTAAAFKWNDTTKSFS